MHEKRRQCMALTPNVNYKLMQKAKDSLKKIAKIWPWIQRQKSASIRASRQYRHFLLQFCNVCSAAPAHLTLLPSRFLHEKGQKKALAWPLSRLGSFHAEILRRSVPAPHGPLCAC